MTAVDQAYVASIFEEAVEDEIALYTLLASIPRKAMEAKMMDAIRTMYRDGNKLDGTEEQIAAYEAFGGVTD